MAKNIQDFLYGDGGRSLVYQGKITSLPQYPREGGVFLLDDAIELGSKRLPRGTFITYVNGSWEEWGGSGMGQLEWKYINSNTTAEDGYVYIADTSNQQFTLNVPSSIHTNATFAVVGFGGAFTNNKLIVNMNNQRVNGSNRNTIEFENVGESALFHKVGGNTGWAAVEYGDSLIVQQYDENTMASLFLLKDNGSGETHIGLLTFEQLTELVTGQVSSITVKTTEDNGHTHTLNVTFVNDELVVDIVDNHNGSNAHTIDILGFGSGSGDLANILQQAKTYTDTSIDNLGLGSAAFASTTSFATAAQGGKADSALQDGDDVSRLSNDVGFITAQEVPVNSVAGKTGDVDIFKSDIGDFNEADYATAAQGEKADSALQRGGEDNVSELNNDAGYLTDADMSDFVTEDDLDNKGFLTDADMSDYVTEEELDNKGFLTEADMSEYITEDDLGDYAKTEDLEDYVKEDELEDSVEGILDELDLLTESQATSMFPELGEDGLVSEYNLPPYLIYKGEWDASENEPMLIDNMQSIGNFYEVTVAGNNAQTGNRDWRVGDWAVCLPINEDGDTEWVRWEFSRLKGALQAGDPISALINDEGYITSADLSSIESQLELLPDTFVESINNQTGNIELDSSYILDLSDNAIHPDEKGAIDGVAELDGNGKVVVSQLPDELFDGLTFAGAWDADVNDPELGSGIGDNGTYYIVEVEGNTELDGIDVWRERDWAVFAGDKWVRIKNTLSSDVLREGDNIDRLNNNVNFVKEEDLVDLLDEDYIPSGQKGANDGVAELDAGGKVPTTQLPEDIQGNLAYKGNWDADENTPELLSGEGREGDFYIVSESGDTNLDGIASWAADDWALFYDGEWIRISNALPSNILRKEDNISELVNDEGYITSSDIPVNSVAGRTGDVELELADLTDFDEENFVLSAEKGANDGVAELDEEGKVPTGQLPEEVLSNIRYVGEWDADENTQNLEDSEGEDGEFYIVSVEGNTELNGITTWRVGDWVVRVDGNWTRLINSENPDTVKEDDDISRLTNDVGYITSSEFDPIAPTEISGTVDGDTLEHRIVYMNDGTTTLELKDKDAGTMFYLVNTDGENITFTYSGGTILSPGGTVLNTEGAWVSVMYLKEGLISIVGDL